MDLIIKNARLADRPGEPPCDIGVQDGRIAAIAPSLPDSGESYDAGGRLVCAGLIETHIHLDKSRIVGRVSAAGRAPGQPGDDDRAAEKGFYRRGRLPPRRGDIARVPRQRHDADAHAARNRPGRRIAQLRGRTRAGGRLPMGDRPRNLRLSAGRDDQLSRHRGTARCGAETGRAGARRGAALRQRPGGADRARLRAGKRVRCRSRPASRCRRRPEPDAHLPGARIDGALPSAAAGLSPGTWRSCRCCRRPRLRRWRGVSPMPGSPSPY